MYHAKVRYAFLSTYEFTIFLKQAPHPNSQHRRPKCSLVLPTHKARYACPKPRWGCLTGFFLLGASVSAGGFPLLRAPNQGRQLALRQCHAPKRLVPGREDAWRGWWIGLCLWLVKWIRAEIVDVIDQSGRSYVFTFPLFVLQCNYSHTKPHTWFPQFNCQYPKWNGLVIPGRAASILSRGMNFIHLPLG